MCTCVYLYSLPVSVPVCIVCVPEEKRREAEHYTVDRDDKRHCVRNAVPLSDGLRSPGLLS